MEHNSLYTSHFLILLAPHLQQGYSATPSHTDSYSPQTYPEQQRPNSQPQKRPETWPGHLGIKHTKQVGGAQLPVHQPLPDSPCSPFAARIFSNSLTHRQLLATNIYRTSTSQLPATKTALNVAVAGSEGRAGNKNGPKRGWGGVRRQPREQKQHQTWPGRGQKGGPGTKTAPNVAGAGSEGRAGNKTAPKRDRDT